MTTDSTNSILQSAKRFFSGTLLSRCSGMLRDIAMAYTFGTEAAVAAFLVAFRFAHLLRRLFGEGALQSAFIPHFEELRIKDPKRAGSFFHDLIYSLTLFLILLIVVIMVSLGTALALLDLSPGTYEIILLTLLLMPSLLFICLFGINASLLQCEKNFFTSGFAPVLFNLIWALGVLSLSHLPAPQAMPWLAGFVIIACFAQWAFTLPKTIHILRQLHSLHSKTDIKLFSPDVRSLIKPLILGIIGVAASQINNALDSLFARFANAEGPAYLWYALRIQQLPLALFGIAIAGALLPPLSRALKNNNLTTFDHFLEFALQRTIGLMLPITAAIFVMGHTVIELIYGRGDFNTTSIIETSQCLSAYASGLLPMTLILILAPAFYATNNYRITSLASLASMLLNIALNAWWIMGLKWGSQSVAWATSLSAFANLLWLALTLPHNNALKSPNLWKYTTQITLVSLLAATTTLFTDIILNSHSATLQIWLNTPTPTPPTNFSTTLLKLISQATPFLLVWLSSLYLFKLHPKQQLN